MKSHLILARHMLGAIKRIEQYMEGLSKEDFLNNFLVQDGVFRNLEIIGEASKKIDNQIKSIYDDIP